MLNRQFQTGQFNSIKKGNRFIKLNRIICFIRRLVVCILGWYRAIDQEGIVGGGSRVGVEMIRGRIKDEDRPRREEEAPGKTYFDFDFDSDGKRVQQWGRGVSWWSEAEKVRKAPLVIIWKSSSLWQWQKSAKYVVFSFRFGTLHSILLWSLLMRGDKILQKISGEMKNCAKSGPALMLQPDMSNVGRLIINQHYGTKPNQSPPKCGGADH